MREILVMILVLAIEGGASRRLLFCHPLQSENFAAAALYYRNWLTLINSYFDVICLVILHKNICKSFLGEWNHILNVLMELTDLNETCNKFSVFGFFYIVDPFTTWIIDLFYVLSVWKKATKQRQVCDLGSLVTWSRFQRKEYCNCEHICKTTTVVIWSICEKSPSSWYLRASYNWLNDVFILMVFFFHFTIKILYNKLKEITSFYISISSLFEYLSVGPLLSRELKSQTTMSLNL